MKLQPFWDRLFLMRPTLLVPTWTFLLLGNYHSFPQAPKFIPDSKVILAFLSYTMLLAGIYILNQIYDRESDRLNRKLFLIPEGHVRVRSAVLQMILLIGLSLILSGFFSRVFIGFIAISVILGILYSTPPFKLKGRPLFDMMANSVGYGLLNFGIGWLATRNFSIRALELSLPYMFAVAAVYVNTTIMDISGDRKTGDITTGVWLGARRAGYLSMALLAIALLISILVKNYVCLLASCITLPLFILAAKRTDLKSTVISLRLGAPVLVVITSCLYPLFAGILIAGFFLTRWYYQDRFGVVYPSILKN